MGAVQEDPAGNIAPGLKARLRDLLWIRNWVSPSASTAGSGVRHDLFPEISPFAARITTRVRRWKDVGRTRGRRGRMQTGRGRMRPNKGRRINTRPIRTKKEPGTHIAVDAGQIPGGDLLSQDLSSQYHRRCSVSLPGSEWDRVVPPRSGHQRAALLIDFSIQGRDSGCLRHHGSSELLCSVVVSGHLARSLTSTRRIHLSSTSIRPLNRTRSPENKRLRTESSRTDD
jgi:hypothetical protein